MWQVRDELVKHFGSLEAVETGGYRVITTLDWKARRAAEKYITVAAILPHVSKAKAARIVKSLHVSAGDRAWVSKAQRARSPQRRDGRHGLPDRRCPGLRRQRWLLPR